MISDDDPALSRQQLRHLLQTVDALKVEVHELRQSASVEARQKAIASNSAHGETNGTPTLDHSPLPAHTHPRMSTLTLLNHILSILSSITLSMHIRFEVIQLVSTFV